MKRRLLTTGMALATATIWLAAHRSQAIPAFARKHELSCTACHDPFPRLKDYGEAFAGAAFQPADRQMPSRYHRDVGDDALSLLKSLPLAVRGEMYFDMRTDENKGDGLTDFKVPFGLKLLSGGRLAEDIGYYFYFYLSERGEVAGIEDAYIHFNDLFGTDLDVVLGQFQISDPLFKRELRLTFQDYLLYKAKPGLSQSDLTYDRGLMLTYGFDFGLDLTAEVVNGNGTGHADIARDFDTDRYKHFLLRLSQDIGPVRLGVVGYWGKEQLRQTIDADNQVVAVSAPRTNEVFIWGPDLTLSLGRAEIDVQYLKRRDINPYFGPTNAEQALVTHGWLLQAVAELLDEPDALYLVALFNYVDSDAHDIHGRRIREEAYTLNLTTLLMTNIKLLIEYSFARFRSGNEIDEHRATGGIVGAW